MENCLRVMLRELRRMVSSGKKSELLRALAEKLHFDLQPLFNSSDSNSGAFHSFSRTDVLKRLSGFIQFDTIQMHR